MTVVTGTNEVIYLRQGEGTFSTIAPGQAGSTVDLFSLIPTVLDENQIPVGKFYFIPEVIFSSDVIAKTVTLRSTKAILESGSPLTPIVTTTEETIVIDGVPVSLRFTAGDSLTDIVTNINNKVVQALGDAYSSFATVSNNFLTLKTPFPENTFIAIGSGSTMAAKFNIPIGEHYGDLPISARSYLEGVDEAFILTRESVTPNKGEATGRFFDVIKTNGMLRFFSEFDNSLIEGNPRLSLLLDSFAFVFQRYSDELEGFIEQIDLSRVTEDRLEFIAYKFGIDVDEIIKLSNGEVTAREFLKAIMRIIQTKGTNQSFHTIFKFAQLVTHVVEFRTDNSRITDDITQTFLDDFFDRFLHKDSIYRNPLPNYGDTVTAFNQLPIAVGDEVVRVTSDDTIYKFDEATGIWQAVITSLSPVNGKGTNPRPEILDLNWRMANKNQPYLSLSVTDFNNARIVSGFDFQARNGTDSSPILYQHDEFSSLSLQAYILTSISAPFDFSDATERNIRLLINEETVLDITLTDFLGLIKDISAVTVLELKKIIERISPLAISELSDGRMVIASKRYGTSSSLRVLEDMLFGFPSGLTKAHRTSTSFSLTAGGANVTNLSFDEFGNVKPIPEVSTPLTSLTVNAFGGGSPLDGDYRVWLFKDGIFEINSTNPFFGASFDANFGWTSREVISQGDYLQIGTVSAKEGELVTWTPERRRSDYQISSDLTDEQESFIRGFIRDKFGVNGELEPLVSAEPFYFRDGTLNPDQPQSSGVSNTIQIDAFASNEDFILTQEITGLAKKFLQYVRPVHIEKGSIFFNTPLSDSWPKIKDHNTAQGWFTNPVVTPVAGPLNPNLSLGHFDFELDIACRIDTAYGLNDGWFTSGDSFEFSSPTSGEDEYATLNFPGTFQQLRENRMNNELFGSGEQEAGSPDPGPRFLMQPNSFSVLASGNDCLVDAVPQAPNTPYNSLKKPMVADSLLVIGKFSLTEEAPVYGYVQAETDAGLRTHPSSTPFYNYINSPNKGDGEIAFDVDKNAIPLSGAFYDSSGAPISATDYPYSFPYWKGAINTNAELANTTTNKRDRIRIRTGATHMKGNINAMGGTLGGSTPTAIPNRAGEIIANANDPTKFIDVHWSNNLINMASPTTFLGNGYGFADRPFWKNHSMMDGANAMTVNIVPVGSPTPSTPEAQPIIVHNGEEIGTGVALGDDSTVGTLLYDVVTNNRNVVIVLI